MQYEPVIGLEIHAELKTKTKMFCYSPNDPDEKHPNINICPICMGHPGTLPYINKDAVKKVIQVGLAIHGTIPEFSQFDRKNYFYPDLPKGYQISQYEHPLVQGGYLDILNRQIAIRRIHLEEDTGRLIHDPSGESLVDFNRAGVPLMELVTEPDFHSSEEIRQFGEELQKILQYVGASDANMEKGQMRVEVNISLRKENSEFGTKVEIKNINSFRFAADAAEYEMKRQKALLERGEKIIQETRGWNEAKKETFSQRIKEEAHDYRYFPEPDLPPLTISSEFVDSLRATLPELPAAKRIRFQNEYKLDPRAIDVLTRERPLAEYFEETASECKDNHAKLVASFILGDLLNLAYSTATPIADFPLRPARLAPLITFLADGKISNTAAKEVLQKMFHTGEEADTIINTHGLWQVNASDELETIAQQVIAENPKAAEDYKKGKETSLQFLVGQMMRASRGKANPQIALDLIKKLLQ